MSKKLYLIGFGFSAYSFIFVLIHLFYNQLPDLVLGSITTTMSFGFAFMALGYNDFVRDDKDD